MNSGDHDIEDEVASTDNDMANFRASKKDGYGNNSLLKQWKKSYMNGDYSFDPYDGDMYEGQDILDKIQDIKWSIINHNLRGFHCLTKYLVKIHRGLSIKKQSQLLIRKRLKIKKMQLVAEV
ncbi:hypothetical protein Tco_0556339 [Tanacetum coccineum]